MDNTDLRERQAILNMASQDVSVGYLKAISANIEVTILRGENIVRIKDGQEEIVGTVKQQYPSLKPGTQYKLK